MTRREKWAAKSSLMKVENFFQKIAIFVFTRLPGEVENTSCVVDHWFLIMPVYLCSVACRVLRYSVLLFQTGQLKDSLICDSRGNRQKVVNMRLWRRVQGWTR
jgi:hypothetical protein